MTGWRLTRKTKEFPDIREDDSDSGLECYDSFLCKHRVLGGKGKDVVQVYPSNPPILDGGEENSVVDDEDDLAWEAIRPMFSEKHDHLKIPEHILAKYNEKWKGSYEGMLGAMEKYGNTNREVFVSS